MPFLNELLRLVGYPSGSGGALLASFTLLHHSVCLQHPHLAVAGAASLVTAGIEGS